MSFFTRLVLPVASIAVAIAAPLPAEGVTSYVHQRGDKFSSKDLEELCEGGALKVLDLRGSGTRDADLKFIAQNKGLEELRLDSHVITSKGYAELTGLTNLKVLGIEAATAKELEEIFEIIKDYPLEELDISGCRDFNANS